MVDTVPVSEMTATWDASGTTFRAIRMNVTDTASASDSMLIDLKVDGNSRFNVNKNGYIEINPVFDDGGAGTTLFQGIKMDVTDTSSSSSSDFIQLLTGGSEKFSVRKDGSASAANVVSVGTGTVAGLLASSSAVAASSLGRIGFSTTTNITTGMDTYLKRDAAGS